MGKRKFKKTNKGKPFFAGVFAVENHFIRRLGDNNFQLGIPVVKQYVRQITTQEDYFEKYVILCANIRIARWPRNIVIEGKSTI